MGFQLFSAMCWKALLSPLNCIFTFFFFLNKMAIRGYLHDQLQIKFLNADRNISHSNLLLGEKVHSVQLNWKGSLGSLYLVSSVWLYHICLSFTDFAIHTFNIIHHSCEYTKDWILCVCICICNISHSVACLNVGYLKRKFIV